MMFIRKGKDTTHLTTEEIYIPRHDYDNPWKEMLSEYFHEFMTFFFPDVSQDIDWTRRYELLDKELRQITREADIGVRLADHLVKVWKKNGEETWALAIED